jgi:non-ribosomal peptide synthetase component E (peptide arylation enzyme)
MTQSILFIGGSAVLNEKFDAGTCLAAIEKHRPTVLNLVPTSLLRMLRSNYSRRTAPPLPTGEGRRNLYAF